MDKRKLTFIQNALRRASYKWPGRWLAEKRFKGPGRNQYLCAMCSPTTFYKKKDTELDHIIPVVDPEKGFTSLDEWADRLFVDESGWQRLCLKHHEEKTLAENKNRVEPRRKRKLKKASVESIIEKAENIIEEYKVMKKKRK